MSLNSFSVYSLKVDSSLGLFCISSQHFLWNGQSNFWHSGEQYGTLHFGQAFLESDTPQVKQKLLVSVNLGPKSEFKTSLWQVGKDPKGTLEIDLARVWKIKLC